MVAFNPHYFMQQIFIICVALDEFLNPSKVVLVQRHEFEITILFCYPWTCLGKLYLSPTHPYTIPPKTCGLYGCGWLINSFFSWGLERTSANRLKVRKFMEAGDPERSPARMQYQSIHLAQPQGPTPILLFPPLPQPCYCKSDWIMFAKKGSS